MTIQERLSALRAEMEKSGVHAYIIPTEDPHGSEYVTPHWKCREWISGFSGSAGTVVVTKETAGLWTDFRYYIQAAEELQGSGIDLFKFGMADVPSYEAWLSQNMKKGEIVAYDGRNFSVEAAEKLSSVLVKSGISVNQDLTLVENIWVENRPSLPNGQVFIHQEKFHGKKCSEKISALRNIMKEMGASHHIISSLEDICWLFNIRGKDLDSIPVLISYAIITDTEALLFAEESKVQNVKSVLEGDNIQVQPYERIMEAIEDIPGDSKVLADKKKISISLINALNSTVEIVYETNPSTKMKALKNEVEISNIRRIMELDGVAVTRFLKWIDENAGRVEMSELSLAAKLLSFRQMSEEFAGESFTPIPGYRAHGALCHYSADEESQYTVDKDGGLFLIDSGGQYEGGTTDITRTVTLGNPTEQEIRDYTLVLKGHIALSMAQFPQGTRGYQIDFLARQAMWKEGIDYGHGTGHGVGHYLSVHEGPLNISPRPIDVALEPGMLVSNEPGIYREGSHGIRIENLILVQSEKETDFGRFYNFETMTLCPYEPQLIDGKLLSEQEKSWFNDYNKTVYERLGTHLNEEERAWLKERTVDFVL